MSEKTERMRVKTINIPEQFVLILDDWVKRELFASRSDAIRKCLHEFFVEEAKFQEAIRRLCFEITGVE